MKRQLIIFLFILFKTLIFAQEVNTNSIELKEMDNFENLHFLKDKLKDVQVVMLGEQTHNDGNVFEAKTEIIKFLVDEMGFNTIAFESGIYDLWKASKLIKEDNDVHTVFQNSIFSIWGKTKEFQSFIEFYAANKNTLNLFGFDYQITSTNGTQNLSKELFKYAKKVKFKFKFKENDFELLLESISNSSMFDEEDIEYKEFDSNLKALLSNIKQQQESEEKFYWNQITKSLIELGRDAYFDKEILSTFSTTSSDNIRDAQMADNLLAYIEKNPHAKIICWGANAHFANNINSITEPTLKEFTPMGSYIKTKLQDKVYSLAAITAQDSIFLQNEWHKTPIQSNSIESFLKRECKSPYAFFSSNQQSMVWNRLFSPITFVKGKLNEFHDGYLFFKDVQDATTIDLEIDVENEQDDIETPRKENASINSSNNLNMSTIALNEVVIYSKKSAYQIIEKVIQNLDKNYLNIPFNSEMFTNVAFKVSDTLISGFDFVANQYDLGYPNHNYRSTKKIKEIRWSLKDEWQPSTLQEFHGLMYCSPIQYHNLLKKNKFKKFVLNIDETKVYNNKTVYVISYTTPRQHSTYTNRVYLSNFSGYLYVNKDDFAVVKVFENWNVTEFPEHFKLGYNFKNRLTKYAIKEYTTESTTTDFVKVGDHYYINQSTNNITGKLYNEKGENKKYALKTNSNWKDYNFENPEKIKPKGEQLIFKKVKYNKSFWDKNLK
ncbi:erythromycin esterase family protein [Mesoflavibacter zeaxanthinifaciens]|uniref:erythromycin esterase family protein n=1 Tax=Mesoflavibacter zeaxanthinifaciens TaxID=393060 RepID=UPI003A94A1A0